MNLVRRMALSVALVAAVAGPAPVRGQTPPQTPAATPPQNQTSGQKPQESPKFDETVVVSASKAEERLIDAPATMSVITSQSIETAPSANFADLLRAIPGVNITQAAAGDDCR